jgi:hypothetical protein
MENKHCIKPYHTRSLCLDHKRPFNLEQCIFDPIFFFTVFYNIFLCIHCDNFIVVLQKHSQKNYTIP